MTGRLRDTSTVRVACAGNNVLVYGRERARVSQAPGGHQTSSCRIKNKCEHRIANFTSISPGSPEANRGRRRQAEQAGRRQTDRQTGRGESGGMRASNNNYRSKVLKIVVSLFHKSRFCARVTQSVGSESASEINSAHAAIFSSQRTGLPKHPCGCLRPPRPSEMRDCRFRHHRRFLQKRTCWQMLSGGKRATWPAQESTLSSKVLPHGA